MPTKKALDKAFDAGQAAQLIGAPDWGNPFGDDRPEERAEWFRGKKETLADKWQPGGRNIYQDIGDKVTLRDKVDA